MAWTQDQADALRVAIAKGVKRVTAGGMTQEFQSLEQMRDLLAEMDRQLNAVPQYRLVDTRKAR